MEVITLRGKAIAEHVDALGRLRIDVFREWPYLYDGDLGNEARYLRAFAKAKTATLVVVVDGGEVVGVSSALALDEEHAALRRPFSNAGLEEGRWFYLAESVLKAPYRGQGLGHRFFDEREAVGCALGFQRFAFCAVERHPNDPRRPAHHRDLAPFWKARGYRESDLYAELDWREVDAPERRRNRLRFWLKE